MDGYDMGALGGNLLLLALIVLIAVSVISWNRKKSKYYMKSGSKRLIATIIGCLVVIWFVGAMFYNDGSTYLQTPNVSAPWTQEDKQSFYSTCVNNATKASPDNSQDTINKYCGCVTDNLVNDYPDYNKANQLTSEEYIGWEKTLIGTCQ